MNYYLKLQFTRLRRWLQNFGIHPTLGIVLGILLFILLSNFLFSKTSEANWIYLVLAFSAILRLAGRSRNESLKNKFNTRDYRRLRLIENGIISLPFITYLLFRMEWLSIIVLISVSIVLALFSNSLRSNYTIPTPFKRFPFEFIVGFRKTFWMIAIAYFIIYKAVQVDNYNLGLFGIGIIFLVSLSFYNKPESKYFVWIYSQKVNGFLKKKILNSFICITILNALAYIILMFTFSENWMTTQFLYLIGYLLLVTMLVAKYTSFPEEMNLLNGILLALSIIFPPILLITVWIFYSQSRESLKSVLE